MTETLYQILSLDLPAASTAVFAAVSCALLGNFLVLKKLSLLGDAISHSVLPGIVVAFFLTDSRSTPVVFAGAAVAGVISVFLVELVERLGRVESGAAMGVIFSLFFALGVLLIEQASSRNVDLDAECLLHGQLETVFWYPPRELGELLSLKALLGLPTEVISSFAVMVLSIMFVCLFYKELLHLCFDPAHASALGLPSGAMYRILLVFIAASVVVSFEAVGSILVIAMLICPAATARLFTDRFRVQLVLSCLFGAATALAGYVLGAFGPQWLGLTHSVNAAGMIAVCLGVLLIFSALFAPNYGLSAKKYREAKLGVEIMMEDILGILFRIEEQKRELSLRDIKRMLRLSLGQQVAFLLSLKKARAKGLVRCEKNRVWLTDEGRIRAQRLIRSHRLWESYLVEKLALAADHVHDTAERLEHFTTPDLRVKLEADDKSKCEDPMGRPIPREI